MSTERQAEASRRNGARSRGPVTERGKQNSSKNSLRHGLLAQNIVLAAESQELFIALLERYREAYQPANAIEADLLETMAIARWRLIRVWGAQKINLDRDIALQDPTLGPVCVRAIFALNGLPDSACAPETIQRYENSYDRQFNRALSKLMALQARRPNPAKPYFPEGPSGQTWADDFAATYRTPDVTETKDEPDDEPRP